MRENHTQTDREAILKARAKALAEPKHAAEEQAMQKTVCFMLAEQACAMELRFVREVIRLKQPTPIPGVPAHIAGIVNLRGEIVSLMDLALLLNLKSGPATTQGYGLILASTDMSFGVQADSILGIAHIPADALHAALPTHTGIRKKYLKGMTDSGMVLLDGGKLLADPELV